MTNSYSSSLASVSNLIEQIEEFSCAAYREQMAAHGIYLSRCAGAEQLSQIINEIGAPLEHDDEDRIVWDIKPESAPTDGARSHTFEEFPLHTDGCFEEPPPSHIALCVLRQDKLGGGQSIVVDFNEVVSSLSDKTSTILSNPLRWRVPSEFKKGIEFLEAPLLLGGSNLRYRRELLAEESLTVAQRTALAELEELLAQPRFRVKFLLPEGCTIFLDNRRMLHARTAILDSSRHLIRMRYRHL